MSVRGKIKQNARRALGQNYVKALSVHLIGLCVILLYMVLLLIANVVTELFAVPMSTLPLLDNMGYVYSPVIMGVTGIVQLLLFAPLSIGLVRWFYRLSGADIPSVVDVFEPYESARSYFGSVLFYLGFSIRTTFYWIVFMLIPGGVLAFGVILLQGLWIPQNLATDMASLIGGLLSMLGLVLILLASVLFFIFSMRYQLAPYLYASGECGPVKCFARSIKLMHGHKSELFLFNLSYFGWFILCILVFPILYVAPYYATASALYSRYIIEYYARRDALRESAKKAAQESSDTAIATQDAPSQAPFTTQEFPTANGENSAHEVPSQEDTEQ